MLRKASEGERQRVGEVMAFVIKAVDRDQLPEGKDWVYVSAPDGQMFFLMDRATELVWTPEMTATISEQIKADASARCDGAA